MEFNGGLLVSGMSCHYIAFDMCRSIIILCLLCLKFVELVFHSNLHNPLKLIP